MELMAEQNSIYGGQAVIEGVMFAGKNVHVTAVRKKDGSLDYLEVPKKVIPWVQSLKKIPFVRGIVGIIESSAKGAQHLNFSAESFAEQEGEEDKGTKKEEKPGFFSNISMVLGVAVVGVISFLFGKFVFTLVPAVIEQFLFQNVFSNQILHNLIEGVIKIILLVGYIYFISLTPMIRRLFQYHGAEHKVISAYEAGVELTVSNVQKFNTLHYRCGSSFIVFTVLIGVVIYSFLHYDGYVERILQRLLLLPVVIGVSYEVLRFTNSLREVPVLRYLGYPGLWLQLLTTKEPEDHQVEVSIASFNRMREAEQRISEGRA
ncbi:membrane protein [Paenibacillus marchantiophytorum]|uniref:Membrane protein n=2 Tax=Paenibacillus marchantiophytorum TaxID=1619310 RepID=A0ABQ1F4E3_9BACL|nr:membrane protein [Paenibacillus marchantiophytorum]